jgi:hypothetical protein
MVFEFNGVNIGQRVQRLTTPAPTPYILDRVSAHQSLPTPSPEKEAVKGKRLNKQTPDFI